MAESIYLSHTDCYHRIVKYSYIFIHSLKGYRNVDKGTGEGTKMKIKLTA